MTPDGLTPPPTPPPVDVSIAAVAAPVPVTIEPPKRQEPTIAAVDREKLKSQGQRDINTLWERTQSVIALSVTFTALGVNAFVAIRVLAFADGGDITTLQLAALGQLNVMAALVTGFYFSRTNHQAIGGVGPKDDEQEYKGR